MNSDTLSNVWVEGRDLTVEVVFGMNDGIRDVWIMDLLPTTSHL